MRGIADGAKLTIEDIIALNVRTEIAFGLFKDGKDADGCTSLAYVPPSGGSTLLGQTWDWLKPQRQNLVLLRISPNNGKPRMHFITEGGIVGKIGFNEYGVGVCLNAIRARGLSANKFPIHLALRTALESGTLEEAVSTLSKVGSASAAHILVAGPHSAVSLEFSSQEVQKLEPNIQGIIGHTNHYLVSHDGIYSPKWLDDSAPRYNRAMELADKVAAKDNIDVLLETIFTDVQNSPNGICQLGGADKAFETIFAIAMDCTEKKARALIGVPVNDPEVVDLSF